MKPQTYDEEVLIAAVTLPESVHEDVRCANIDKALNPSNFPDPTAMATVSEYLSHLTSFQRGLLTDALILSLRESHGARVSFFVQDCGYALEGTGLEIRNDTVAEDERRPLEERLQPMKIIFAVNREYERMRR